MSKVPRVPATVSEIVTTNKVASTLPTVLNIAVSQIAMEVVGFENESIKAVEVAKRLEISDADSAGRVTDIIRAVTAAIGRLDAARKLRTADLKKTEKSISGAYKPCETRYEQAKTILTAKLGVYRRSLEAEIIAKSEERKAHRAELAQKLADQQTALGDTAGAQQILEEVAALPVPVEKVVVTGDYGSSLSVRKRPVLTVTNNLQFMRALTDNTDLPEVCALIAGMTFSKAALNALAKVLHDQGAFALSGSELSITETDVVI